MCLGEKDRGGGEHLKEPQKTEPSSLDMSTSLGRAASRAVARLAAQGARGLGGGAPCTAALTRARKRGSDVSLLAAWSSLAEAAAAG